MDYPLRPLVLSQERMDMTVDAILEAFTWVGLAGAALLGLLTLLLWAVDGSWLPARAVIDHEETRTLVRWFDDEGGVNSAEASHSDADKLAGESMTDIWYRHGATGRFRLTRRSPAVRAAGWLSLGMLGLAIVAAVTSWVLLFVRG